MGRVWGWNRPRPCQSPPRTCSAYAPASPSHTGVSSACRVASSRTSWGAGTRAAQFLTLGAKARALLQGRAHVSKEDIIALAAPVLRHRVLVNYRAEAEGVSVAKVIERVLASVN